MTGYYLRKKLRGHRERAEPHKATVGLIFGTRPQHPKKRVSNQPNRTCQKR